MAATAGPMTLGHDAEHHLRGEDHRHRRPLHHQQATDGDKHGSDDDEQTLLPEPVNEVRPPSLRDHTAKPPTDIAIRYPSDSSGNSRRDKWPGKALRAGTSARNTSRIQGLARFACSAVCHFRSRASPSSFCNHLIFL